MREKVAHLLATKAWEWSITALIIINAITLGLETSASVMAAIGPVLLAIDKTILGVFVVEIAMRLYAHRARFFKDPWSLFDLTIVGIALMPDSGPFSVLRALRILRVLRLISVVPSLRKVVVGLIAALPGMGSIILLMCIVFYVASVMATELFKEAFPEFFGTLGASAYTLFQIMTLESWSMGISRPVMEVFPYAWIFFVPFILLSTFVVLNLFIGVVVSAMQEQVEETATEGRVALADEAASVHASLAKLSDDVAELKGLLQTNAKAAERQ